MRVIDHKRLKEARRIKEARQRSRRIIFVFTVTFLLGFVFVYAKRGEAPSTEFANNTTTPSVETKKGTLKTFTPQQFRDLYNNFAYPNTETISDKTPITGSEALDGRIRQIASQRGYTLRSAPVSDTFRQVAPGMLLQERAAQPWLDMQAAAKKDVVALGISAAYRSASEQLSIFLSRFTPRQASPQRVASGYFDRQIGEALAMTAPPGYSRHHTGYTVDIMCDNNINQIFENTPCFRWLSLDNYKNAKTFGWIPSYPEGTASQGPEPESWEYVWVGVDALTE
jgi:LAS superfamily LD-carboxypeptidase LdcB